MKTDLENAIIKLGKVLQEENESLDNIDTESLEILALILNCEVTVRNTRVLTCWCYLLSCFVFFFRPTSVFRIFRCLALPANLP